MSFLRKVSPVRILRRAFARVINVESVPAFDKYEHIRNMKTEDLFQFEPFHDKDLLTFPREAEGKDYDLNWSLASEWFTVWGNAFRNPSCGLLMRHLKCVRDENGNAFCKRSYLSGIDVPVSQANFEELSDTVKEFLSEVPNLYVEDAAVSSGRLLEVRIRSITNDPATALAMKQMLHRMPLRDPQTPHPLGLIVARGMPQTFTAIGEDPHSRALTVLVGGDAPVETIVQQLVQATRLYYERERGTVDVPTSPVPIKGPLTKCVLPCSTLKTASGEALCVFGLSDSFMTSLAQQDRLFCDHYSVVCRDGLSRVFAGMPMDPTRLTSMKNEMVLNQKVYRAVPGDNLMPLPSQVLFVDNDHCERELRDGKEVKEMLRRFVKNEEYVSFVAEKMEQSVFRTVRSESLVALLQ